MILLINVLDDFQDKWTLHFLLTFILFASLIRNEIFRSDKKSQSIVFGKRSFIYFNILFSYNFRHNPAAERIFFSIDACCVSYFTIGEHLWILHLKSEFRSELVRLKNRKFLLCKMFVMQFRCLGRFKCQITFSFQIFC